MNDQAESTKISNHAGRDLVRELAERRILGSYFGFQGYVKLRKVATVHELQNFLDEQGYPQAPVERGPSAVADYLAVSESLRGRKALTAWAIVESLLWILGVLTL